MEEKMKQLDSALKNIAAAKNVSIYPFDISELDIDPALRLKCQIPLCANYGQIKMCPPNFSPPLSLIREAMKSYRIGYLIVIEKSLQGITGDEEKNKEAKASKLELLDVVNEMENAAIVHGFYKTIGLAAGSCNLCETCAPAGEPCRHPHKARPGPSALGMDVTALALKKGVDISWPPKDKVLAMGLLLV